MSDTDIVDDAALVTYTLQVFGPIDRLETLALKAAVGWQEILRETEENLTDLLPAGYRVEIKEWDADE